MPSAHDNPRERLPLVLWLLLLVGLAGCRLILVRGAGDVSVETNESDARLQNALGTNALNRNVEAAIEVTP